jgi:predicted RNA-binding protein with PUA-like domain
MPAYLLKTEPTVYSFADLERDKETIWDGVTNPQAVKHLREMPKGSDLIIYHTGDERTAVGTAKVLSVDTSNPKTPLVKIKVGKPVKQPKTLTAIKASPLFADSPLVIIGRLSVVPLSEDQFAWIIGD